MARKRKTQGVLWQERTEAEALEHFERSLSELPDPRRSQGIRYPLHTVVVTALMAMVCGADDAEAMQKWGEANEPWLAGFLELPHGSPTQDVFLAVFAALDPAAFTAVFRTWIDLLRVRLQAQRGQLAVDGKTSRRSYDRAGERPAIHTLSAWMVEAGLVVGQLKTDQKSNEITAIPELLRLLDLEGTTVTIDAMGCQTAIAETIREGGGDYLLSVKDNQPTLRRDVVASFADAADTTPRPLDQAAPLAVERWQETTKDHGRLEEREVLVCRDLSWIETAARWPDLVFIAKASSIRTNLSTGEQTSGTRYFIGSGADVSVDRVAELVRGHWGIENSVHWVLDVAFREDQARHRAGNCAQNLTTLRHVALDLLRSESTNKLGVANKRKCAGWDRGVPPPSADRTTSLKPHGSHGSVARGLVLVLGLVGGRRSGPRSRSRSGWG